MNHNPYGQLVGLGALVLVGLGIAAYFGIEESNKNKAVAPFEARLTEYTSIPAPPPGKLRESNARPKMITIDWKERKVDRIWFDLPPEMRPETPEEVQTIVWLQWGEEKIDEYQGGGWACRWLCTVTVFDKETKQVVAQEEFRGGEPPQVTSTPAGSNDYGTRPSGEIVSFLRSVAGK